MKAARRAVAYLLTGVLAAAGSWSCSDSAARPDGAAPAEASADRDGEPSPSDGTQAAEGAPRSDGAETGSRCTNAGGTCQCTCGGSYPVDAPEHNDCPQPCETCGACSLFCCLPDPACDITAGCLELCEGGLCDCWCPPENTACGDTSCDRKTEVCVGKGPFGPSVIYGCEAVPAGCETKRACACLRAQLCAQNDTCVDEGDNKIFCDNSTQ